MLNNIDSSIYKNIDLKSFQGMLDESLTTSYKILWFKGIVEEVKEGKREIYFVDILVRMIISAWSPIVRYKLNFGAMDQFEKIIKKIIKKFDIDAEIKKDKLYKLLIDNKDSLDEEIKLVYKYVPYRLLSPFYKKNLTGTDYEKQKQIIYLNKSDENALYIINEKDKFISIINDEWFVFLYANQKILKEWSDLKYINFLQKRNMSIPAIPLKIDFVAKRDIAIQTRLFKELLNDEEISDIYTGDIIRHNNFSVDHFLPWSFVLHDELWNLGPTLKNINSSKNDNLPNLDEYIESFCEFQYSMVNYIKNKKINKKNLLESYLNIDINIFDEINKDEFFKKLKNIIEPLHQIAFNQGFKVWDSSNYIKSISVKSIDNIENIILKI